MEFGNRLLKRSLLDDYNKYETAKLLNCPTLQTLAAAVLSCFAFEIVEHIRGLPMNLVSKILKFLSPCDLLRMSQLLDMEENTANLAIIDALWCKLCKQRQWKDSPSSLQLPSWLHCFWQCTFTEMTRSEDLSDNPTLTFLQTIPHRQYARICKFTSLPLSPTRPKLTFTDVAALAGRWVRTLRLHHRLCTSPILLSTLPHFSTLHRLEFYHLRSEVASAVISAAVTVRAIGFFFSHVDDEELLQAMVRLIECVPHVAMLETLMFVASSPALSERSPTLSYVVARLPCLQVLVLHTHNMTDLATALLIRGLAVTAAPGRGLRVLDLRDNEVGDDAVDELAALLKKNKIPLESLRLAANRITPKGAAVLGTALATNQTLTRLEISTNAIETMGAVAIVTALRTNATLTDLSMARCRLSNGQPIIDALRQAANVSNLISLSLAENSIFSGNSAHTGRLWADFLANSRTLTSLNISQTGLGGAGIAALVQSLRNEHANEARDNSVLYALNLGANRLLGIAWLPQLLDALPCVEDIDVSGNLIPLDSVQQLIEQLGPRGMRLSRLVLTENMRHESAAEKQSVLDRLRALVPHGVVLADVKFGSSQLDEG